MLCDLLLALLAVLVVDGGPALLDNLQRIVLLFQGVVEGVQLALCGLVRALVDILKRLVLLPIHLEILPHESIQDVIRQLFIFVHSLAVLFLHGEPRLASAQPLQVDPRTERRGLLPARNQLQRLLHAKIVLRLLFLQFLRDRRQLALIPLLFEQAHATLLPALFLLILDLGLPLHVESNGLHVQVQELLQIVAVQWSEYEGHWRLAGLASGRGARWEPGRGVGAHGSWGRRSIL